MQNIKNFKLVDATPELLEKFNNDSGILFLQADNGIEWYEAQKLFSDDTVKIQYNSDGVITSVIDAPVPQRDNIYAVSMLWPIDCSVAEIAVADYPAGVALDGTWKFDEETQSVYQDADIVAANTLAEKTAQFNALLRECTDAAFPLQSAVALGIATAEQQAALTALQQYAVELTDPAIVDLTANPVSWPPRPNCLT